MKSGKIIWLGILVVCVWGAVVFQVYRGLSTETGNPSRSIVMKTTNNTVSKTDYPLILNYRDPFFSGKKPGPKIVLSRPVTKKSTTSTPGTPNIIIQWSKIEYMGSIYNVSRNVTMATIRINGKDYVGKEGAIIDGFTIAEILPDSVRLMFGPQEKYIVKNK